MNRPLKCFGSQVEETIRYLERLHEDEKDPVKAVRLAGFLVLTVISALEVDVRDTCTETGGRFHSQFGTYVSASLSKTNARVSVKELGQLIGRFSEVSQMTFQRRLDVLKRRCQRWPRSSLHAQYENLLTWRNSFAHTGTVSATFDEVMQAARYAGLITRVFRDELRRIRP